MIASMEEHAWVHRPDRQIRFRVLRSSCERSWRGFDAYIYEASDGFSDLFVPDHSISMHVGPPVLVTSRCDGQYVHSLQVPGDIKIVPAGYSRVWEIAAPTSKLVVDLAPWFVREVAEQMGIAGNDVAIAPLLHVRDKAIEHLGWALVNELESEDSYGRLYAESVGIALASWLVQRSSHAMPSRVSGLPKRRLQRVLDYIRENLSHDLTLAELASVAGLSPSHFKTQFRESMGMPVHQYVVSVRVDYAQDLLVRTSLPLVEIALRSGFYNQSHLSRHLRRSFGTTPAELRRQAQPS